MTRARLQTDEVIAVTGTLLLALAPHLLRFPMLLSTAVVGCALWRVLGAQRRLPLPDTEHRWLRVLKEFVALGAFVGIYITYRGQLGRDAGVELLAALLALKLLEMSSPRDYYIVTFLCYFLVVTNFFYSQTLPTAIYMLIVVVLVTAVLVQFNTPPAYRDRGRMLRLAALMTAQAMPLMAVAFLLFPRLPGPLWGLPQDAFDAVSGLSEDMTIGQITRLGMSDEIAFRVEFVGASPRARDLYWRGPVLWRSDGRTWRGGNVGDGAATMAETRGQRYRYAVTLEPHRMRWLLGLDLVVAVPDGVRVTADRRLAVNDAVRQRKRYELTSAADYRLRDVSARERRVALELPREHHPRARALAREWVATAGTPQALVQRALAFFRDNPFAYSLTPPALPGDTVDDFLFTTREGFCEHFASSFVVLMRAAGVPARVVTGYQGGEYNGVGDYLVVRQRDAHAWAEVYLDARGWVRVDPTAAVAPERVSLGSLDSLPRRAGLSGLAPDGVASALWTRLRDTVDAAAYGWSQWVLGYSAQQQQRLLADVGLDDWDAGNLVIALTLALAAVTGVLAVLLLRAKRPATDAAHGAYLRFCARLARVGIVRHASEPPLAFARRAMLARADLAVEISGITRLYTQLRYARSAADTRTLARRVARFRPARRR